MRAVVGSLSSMKPISLSKAAAILSRFASSETGARRDVTAYLKRASNACEDLVQFHKETRDGRKISGFDIEQEEEEEEDGRRKKRKKKKGGDGNLIPTIDESHDRGTNGEIADHREVVKNRRKEEEEENEMGCREVDGDGNLTEVERDHDGGVLGVEEERNGKRKTKKWKFEEKDEYERKSRVRTKGENVKVEEERSEERKKKKEKKNKRRNPGELANGNGFEEQDNKRDDKKRKLLYVEEKGGEVEGENGRHKMKKRRKTEMEG